MEIVVSVIMITYNHEKYINQAIDGVLMQKTNFPVELIVADDASTDKTQEIIKTYQNKNCEIIKPILREKNIGGNNNWIDAYKICTGRYIAICEGDDYWTDPDKLQKQVDFLDANPDYVFCSHNGTVIDETGKDKTGNKLIKTNNDYDFSTEDLLIKNQAATLTVMFKNNIITNFPDWFYNLSYGDRLLYILLSQYGKMRHLDFFGAVYRVNFGNATTKKYGNNNRQRVLGKLKDFDVYPEYIKVFNDYFNNKYDDILQVEYKKLAFTTFLNYFALRMYNKAKKLISSKKVTYDMMKTMKDKIKFFLVRFIIIKR